MTLDHIIEAVYRKDLGTLRTASREDVNQIDEDGYTPLMNAILAEDADAAVVLVLLERGADLNAVDDGQHWTALHFASRDEDAELVRQLVEAGAELDPVDAFGNTPLWRAIFEAAEDTGAIELLLEHGADPHRANEKGISPLDLAQELGRGDLIDLLSHLRS